MTTGTRTGAVNSLPFPLRRWQAEGLRAYEKSVRKGLTDFLLVVITAGGKTTFALESGRRLLGRGEVERVVVVCATRQQCRQFARQAKKFGLNLDANFSNADGVEADGYHGVAVTYQQVSAAPDLFRMTCAERKTLVVLDEIHHVADRRAFGRAVRQAFEVACLRLTMSGTLFRSDGLKIPFVNFVDGLSRPDYSYGYVRAVEDRVCRPVIFHTYEGEVVYQREGSDELYRHTMREVVDATTATERLFVALDPRGGWLPKVIKDADANLNAMRAAGHADAGGLIVARDQAHAKEIARVVCELTGEEPALVISEDPEAFEKIEAFTEDNRRWMVAVRMVSEGTDIPRLRVGVYATNVKTELFLKQFTGRFLRHLPGLREQTASVYLPADETLVGYALRLKEEREYQPAPDDEEELKDMRRNVGIDFRRWAEYLKTVSSESVEGDAVFDGASFPQVELKFAARASRRMGITAPLPHVAALIRLGACQAGAFLRYDAVSGDENTDPGRVQTLSQKELLKATDGMAESLAELTGRGADDVHREWAEEWGGEPRDAASREDLELKLSWLESRLEDEIHRKGHKIGGGFHPLDEIQDSLNRAG